jgi:galactonate dehydratase
MLISKIDTYKILPRWLLLRIETDDGYVGWGEPIVEGKAATTEAAVHELSEMILGKDARRVEDIWQTLYRGGFYRGGPVLMSAISGIDQALWDIKAKALGVPIYECLGGNVRDKMEVYSWIDSTTDEEAARSAKEKSEAGFRKIKMFGVDAVGWINDNKEVDKLLSKLQAIRDEVGKDLGIAIDFHARPHKAMAKTLLKQIEPFNILFVEEPVLVENEEAFAELHSCSNIPLATGERSFSRWDFKNMLQKGYVDIIQPDLSHAGGISEVRRLASMAEAYDVAIAPHCPLGPIAFASCLQIDFSSINACIQEQSLGMAYNQGQEMSKYVKDPSVFAFENGFVGLLKKPGLGIEVNEESIKEMAKSGHNWKNPVLHLEDGSVTEW